jgi:hypothetical protein
MSPAGVWKLRWAYVIVTKHDRNVLNLMVPFCHDSHSHFLIIARFIRMTAVNRDSTLATTCWACREFKSGNGNMEHADEHANEHANDAIIDPMQLPAGP